MKIKWTLLIALAGLFLASCADDDGVTTTGGNNLYIPTDSDTTATASLADLQAGRTLYMNNCNSCHQLYSPDRFSANRWDGILSQMTPRTSMSPDEVALVAKYLKKGK